MLTELMGLAMIGAGLTIKSQFKKAKKGSGLSAAADITESESDSNDRIIDLAEYRKKSF